MQDRNKRGLSNYRLALILGFTALFFFLTTLFQGQAMIQNKYNEMVQKAKK